MTNDINPNDLKGRTVYGKPNSPNEGDTGTITEVREPGHPRNMYKDGLTELLIEYPGNIGKEGVVARKLIDGDVRSWSLEDPGATQ